MRSILPGKSGYSAANRHSDASVIIRSTSPLAISSKTVTLSFQVLISAILPKKRGQMSVVIACSHSLLV